MLRRIVITCECNEMFTLQADLIKEINSYNCLNCGREFDSSELANLAQAIKDKNVADTVLNGALDSLVESKSIKTVKLE